MLVYFRKKSQNVNYEELEIYQDGDRWTFEEEASSLGIIIDGHYSWDKRCDKIANTISRNNGALNRVKKLLPPDSLKMLYNSFILPHQQYGLAAWGGCPTKTKSESSLFKKEPYVQSVSHILRHILSQE